MVIKGLLLAIVAFIFGIPIYLEIGNFGPYVISVNGFQERIEPERVVVLLERLGFTKSMHASIKSEVVASRTMEKGSLVVRFPREHYGLSGPPSQIRMFHPKMVSVQHRIPSESLVHFGEINTQIEEPLSIEELIKKNASAFFERFRDRMDEQEALERIAGNVLVNHLLELREFYVPLAEEAGREALTEEEVGYLRDLIDKYVPNGASAHKQVNFLLEDIASRSRRTSGN